MPKKDTYRRFEIHSRTAHGAQSLALEMATVIPSSPGGSDSNSPFTFYYPTERQCVSLPKLVVEISSRSVESSLKLI